jgi:hypothetical protein
MSCSKKYILPDGSTIEGKEEMTRNKTAEN